MIDKAAQWFTTFKAHEFVMYKERVSQRLYSFQNLIKGLHNQQHVLKFNMCQQWLKYPIVRLILKKLRKF